MADENISIGIDGTATGIVGASQEAAGGVKQVTSSAKDLAAAFKALQSSIDPTFAAQERYNKSLADNRALLAANIISTQEFAAGNKAAAASLQENISMIQANSAEGRAAAAAVKAARAQEAQDARDTAAAVRQAAADKAAAEKQAAADARAAQKTARDAEKVEALATAAIAKQASKDAAAAAKQAAQDEAAAVKAAKADERAASQAVAAQAKADAKTQRDAIVAQNAANKDAANAIRQAAQAQAQMDSQLAQFQAMLSPAVAAQQRYNAQMSALVQLLMAGKLQAGEFTTTQKRLQQQMETNTRSLGRQNVGYIDLGYQVQDVVASFATGINPMVIFAQQGGQTADAVRQMGGRFEGVAAFISGPWGAALLGAVTVLGLLIPKLFDASTASDRFAESEANLKSIVDTTTGSIKEQTTALMLRGAAANAEAVGADQRKSLDKGKQRASQQVYDAITPQMMFSTPGSAGADLGAQIADPKMRAALKDLADDLTTGKIQLDGFADSVAALGKQNPQVMKLSNSLTTLLTKESKPGAGDSYAQTTAQIQKANAESILYTQGVDKLTLAQKRLLGITAIAPGVTDASIKAQAELSVTTDSVTQAKDRQTIAEAAADAVRKKAIATAQNQGDLQIAEVNYIKAVGPYIKAVEDAEKAKAAARAADAQGRRDAKAAAAAARKEAMDDLQASVAEDDYQKQEAVDSYATQVEWQNKKIASLKAFYGDDSKEAINAQRELEKLEQTHNNKLLQISDQARAEEDKRRVDDLKTQQTEAEAGNTIAEGQLDAQHTMGAVDGTPYLEAKRAILEAEYAMNQDYANRIYQVQLAGMLAKQKALEDAGKQESTDYATLLQTIASLTNTYTNQQAAASAAQTVKLAANQDEVAVQATQKWHTASDSITSSLNTAFQDIWTHQHKFGADMLSLADNLVFAYVDAGFKILSNWMAQETAKTVASLFGNKSRQAIANTSAVQDKLLSTTTTGVHVANEGVKTAATLGAQTAQTGATTVGAGTRSAVNLTSDTAEITGRAATSAAGAFSSTVVIPFIGPVAAPVAAAAALAAVLGFTALLSAKGGLGDVPSDQLAMIHKKEMILPAWIAEPLRNSLRGASGGSQSMAMVGGAQVAGADARAATHMTSGSPTFHYSPTVHGGGSDLAGMLQTQGTQFRKWFNNQVRNGAISPQKTGRK